MKVRLLTNREENIIRTYLDTGEKIDGFAVVKDRFQKQEFHYVLAQGDALTLQEFKNRLGVEKRETG